MTSPTEMQEADGADAEGGADRDPRAVRDTEAYGDAAPEGLLRTLQGAELATHVYHVWAAQNIQWRRRLLEYRVNERRRNGESGVYLVKNQNLGSFEMYTPPGNRPPVPVYNKADRLCQRLTSNLLADDFEPLVEPAQDSDTAKDASGTTQRALDDLNQEGNLNLSELMRGAVDAAHTGGSGYLHLYLDPYAGGRHPVQVDASPSATHVDHATRDPGSGLPWPDAAAPVVRYVQPDGTLTDGAAGAALQWRPRLDGDVLHARHVRFTPWDSRDVWDADGVLIAEYLPWGQVVRRYPSLAGSPDDAVRALAAHRPAHWTDYLPLRDGRPYDPGQPPDTPISDYLVPVLRVYATECGEYPDGARVVIVGRDTVAVQETWVGTSAGQRFRLDLPVVQVRLGRRRGDAHGQATMDMLGDSSESRAGLMGMYFDFMDRIGNRKVFVPTNSPLSHKDMVLDAMTYIPITPGGEPKYEELPALPRELADLFGSLTTEMDDAVGLQETAQGVESGSAVSGRAKLAVISQVNKSMSDIRKNIHQAHVRAWRIELQLMRAGYTKPQQLEWVGDDGAYQLTRWQGSDLVGRRDVTVRPGTGTGMAPMEKIQQALMLQQSGVLQLPEVLDVIGADLGSAVGVRDNPHLHRIKRQLAAWAKGPPAGSASLGPQPQMSPPGHGPMGEPLPPQPVPGPDGQPVMMQPPHPAAVALLAPLPVDAQPDVAVIRLREIGHVMAGVGYQRLPPDWQAALNQAYDAAKQTLAPPPPPAPAPGPPGPPGPAGPSGATVINAASMTPPPFQPAELAFAGMPPQ